MGIIALIIFFIYCGYYDVESKNVNPNLSISVISISYLKFLNLESYRTQLIVVFLVMQ